MTKVSYFCASVGYSVVNAFKSEQIVVVTMFNVVKVFMLELKAVSI